MIEAGSWTVEGIGEDFVPPNADLSLVKKAYSIPDRLSMATARDLLSKEGILAGSSSGTLLAAALKYCREQATPKRVVTFVCDSGNNTFQRSSTITGWPNRACLSRCSMAICAISSPARIARAAPSRSGRRTA